MSIGVSIVLGISFMVGCGMIAASRIIYSRFREKKFKRTMTAVRNWIFNPKMKEESIKLLKIFSEIYEKGCEDID